MRLRGSRKFVPHLLTAVLLCILTACTNTVRVTPMQPGDPGIESPGTGMVFGRIQIIRNDVDELGEMGGHYRAFGWWLTQLGSEKRFVISPLTENGMFVLKLPIGQYRVTNIEYEERLGFWEGRLPATFTVHDGKSTYLGTWEIQMVRFGSGGKISGRVVNQQEAAREELKQTYTESSRPITLGLLDSAPSGFFSLVRPKSEQ